jgi:hypothetical protein
VTPTRIRWFSQSAFLISGGHAIFVDAFGRINGLTPPDAFLNALGARVERIPESGFEPEQLLGTADEPTVALLSAPIERSATR